VAHGSIRLKDSAAARCDAWSPSRLPRPKSFTDTGFFVMPESTARESLERLITMPCLISFYKRALQTEGTDKVPSPRYFHNSFVTTILLVPVVKSRPEVEERNC